VPAGVPANLTSHSIRKIYDNLDTAICDPPLFVADMHFGFHQRFELTYIFDPAEATRQRYANKPAGRVGNYNRSSCPAFHRGQTLGLESMTYWLPRAVIVLIAWATTCLIMNVVTSIDPLVFYLAGAVWASVGLISFSYMYKLRRDEISLRVEELGRYQQPAE
jgi:hypothetical protein